MTKKIENRVNLYFNKTQRDVCEYLNDIDDKSAFVVDLVRKHMHNNDILTSGISEDLEFIKHSLDRLESLINKGVTVSAATETKNVESSVSEKIADANEYSNIEYDPSEEF